MKEAPRALLTRGLAIRSQEAYNEWNPVEQGSLQGFPVQLHKSSASKTKPLALIFAEDFLEPGVKCRHGESPVSPRAACFLLPRVLLEVHARQAAVPQGQASSLLGTVVQGPLLPLFLKPLGVQSGPCMTLKVQPKCLFFREVRCIVAPSLMSPKLILRQIPFFFSHMLESSRHRVYLFLAPW